MKIFYINIDDNGKFNSDLFYDIEKYIKTLVGKNIEIKIGVKGKIRSKQQNRLYWMWMNLLESETQQGTGNDFHNAFKNMFLTDNGILISHIKSTTELSTKEFKEYLDKIERWTWDKISSEFQFPKPPDLYI